MCAYPYMYIVYQPLPTISSYCCTLLKVSNTLLGSNMDTNPAYFGHNHMPLNVTPGVEY